MATVGVKGLTYGIQALRNRCSTSSEVETRQEDSLSLAASTACVVASAGTCSPARHVTNRLVFFSSVLYCSNDNTIQYKQICNAHNVCQLAESEAQANGK